MRSMERAGFYVRTAAFLVDLLLFAVIAHLAAAVDLYLNLRGGWNDFGGRTVTIAWLTLVIFGVLEWTLGSTPGKRVMGLSIRAEDGRPAAPGALRVRAGFKYLPALFAALPAIVYAVLGSPLWFSLSDYVRAGLEALFTIDMCVALLLILAVVTGCFQAMGKSRQAAHDRLAGTAVFPIHQIRRTHGFAPVLGRPPAVTHDGPSAPPALSLEQEP